MTLILLLPIRISAGEYSYSSDELGEKAASDRWDELLDSLPGEVGDEIGGINPDELPESLEKLREKTDFTYWIKKAAEEIKSALPDFISAAAPLISMIILSSAVSFCLPESPRIAEAFMISVKLTSSVMLFTFTSRVIGLVSEYLSRLCSVMNLFLPVMEAVTLSGGSISEKSVQAATITLGVTLIGNFNAYVMTPLISALFSLAAVSMISGDTGMGGMVTAFRRFVNRLWQISAILFSFLLGIQTILAKGADNLAAKGAKFAIGSFIPIAGGMLSEVFTTLREGLTFVRGVCGVGGIVVILLFTLPALVPVVLFKLSLSISKTASEILKCDALTPMLAECCGIVDFMLGVMLSSEVMFLLSILLFAKSW